MDSKPVNHTDLVSLLDELVEFNDYCAFLCDALSALFSEYADSDIDGHTIQGVKLQCSDLKGRSENLENVLNTLYQQSYTDSQITALKPNT